MDSTGAIKNRTHNHFSEKKGLSDAQERLEFFLAENSAFLEHENNASARLEEIQASLVKKPMTTESAVAFLGLFTGSIPTTAIFLKLLEGGLPNDSMIAVVFVLAAVSVALTSAAGYFSGKLVSRMLVLLESKQWILMFFALPAVGAVWGLFSGAVGGVVLFGIGAVFGAAIGALVAPAVLTIFGVLHRLLKTGDVIERNRFLPIAFGLTLTIAAIILGL